MTRQRLREALNRLNVWKSGGIRAPHKPLLLLFALGRVRRGQPRLASYAQDVHKPLKKLLRDAVLRAYERRCAVCDFDLRIADDLFGLEAAHIMWHAAGGPDQVPNGLALCTFHHKALDWGVIGLEPESGEYRLMVSNELSGQSLAFNDVLDLRGKPLRAPQAEGLEPSVEYVAWHRQQVFRGEPRSRSRR